MKTAFAPIAIFTVLTLPFSASAETVPLEAVFGSAKQGSPVCYGREYSSDHLEKKQKQTVKKIRAKLVNDSTDPEFPTKYIEVDLTLKGEKNYYRTYRSFLICDAPKGECYVECDGGKVSAWGTSAGKLAIKNHGFVISGGCGEGKELRLKNVKGGDDLFELTPLPAEYCQL